MCKTFEAIHKISKKLQKEGAGGEYIKVIIPGAKIKGMLYCTSDHHDCHEDVITLKDVKVMCFDKPDEVKKLDWLNVPTHHILAFKFLSAEDMNK